MFSFWKKKKEEIKLGKIVDEKLVGVDKSYFYSMDVSLAIILRDSLRMFTARLHGFPPEYEENPEEWTVKLNSIADKFDTYITELRDNGYFIEPSSREVVEEALKELGEVWPSLWD